MNLSIQTETTRKLAPFPKRPYDFFSFDIPPPNGRRIEQIDFIKSFAIISVIILHTICFHDHLRLAILAPFHIWHAVPIFMVLAGINSTLATKSTHYQFIFSNEYSTKKIIKYLDRIVAPFTIIWVIQITMMVTFKFKEITIRQIAMSYFTGGYGPGSYFTPVFIQHLLLFPFIIWLLDYSKKHRTTSAIILFIFAVLTEWICIKLNISEPLYRLLYVRYIFAVVIGVLIARHSHQTYIALLTIPSVAYIASVSYFGYNSAILYPSWGFQHAPAYFYTATLIALLWNTYPYLSRLAPIFNYIGKSSFHIFLFQMFYFWIFYDKTFANTSNVIVWLFLNIAFCLSFGCLYFKAHQIVRVLTVSIFTKKNSHLIHYK